MIYLDLRANVAVHKAFEGRFDVICAGSFLGGKVFRSSYVRSLATSFRRKFLTAIWARALALKRSRCTRLAL